MSNALFSSKSKIKQVHAWGSALVKSGVIKRLFNAKPIWAQLKITDRCNLQCAYCSEHDESVDHVKSDIVKAWVVHCAKLGVKHVEFIGGEPLLHPDLLSFLQLAKELKMNTGLTTNGFRLNKENAKQLIESGISRLQLSIDCIEPNDVTKKAFSVLKPQLQIISDLDIWVHINSVITPQTLPQARELAMLLFDLGIPIAFSPAHDHGLLRNDCDRDQMISFFDWLTQMKLEGNPVNMTQFLIEYFRENVMGEPVSWRCEGGCKAFYVDSSGQFCECSHKPSGMQFTDVNRDVLASNHHREKGCEESCGVTCMLTSSFPYNRLDYVLKHDFLPDWMIAK